MNRAIKYILTSVSKIQLITLFCLVGYATPSLSQTLHLLIFADTDDPGLSAPNLMNISFLTQMANDVCQATGMKNQLKVYKGKEFLASQCDQVLTGFRPAANDVVFFYFMGHGWNNSETEEPMLLFKTMGQSPGPANSRNLKEIFRLLRQKGTRLTLVFGESCNSAINDRSKAKGHNTRIMNVSAIRAEQLKQLFLQSNAAIMLYTCKRGQKSNSSEDGGWFFTSFYDQFTQLTSKSFRQQPASWEALLKASSESTIDYAREQGAVQEPVFLIDSSPQVLHTEPVSKPEITKKTDPISEPENTSDYGNVCAINRVAFKTMQSLLVDLESFRKRVISMSSEAASDEFRKFYSVDRQEFFRQTPQKLNVSKLNPDEVKWFTVTCSETSELLDETIYYINDPQFKNTAYSKLAIPIENMRSTITHVQTLLRHCKE